jgi:abortive infection bacteriophage resistance protein
MQLNNPTEAWLISPLQSKQLNKPFAVISCMAYLCNHLNQSEEIKDRIIALIDSYPNVPIRRYGFLNNWRNEPLWK